MPLLKLLNVNALTDAQLADVLGLSERTVYRLRADKVLRKGTRGYRLSECVQAFVKHREACVKKESSKFGDSYTQSRARRMFAQALSEEMRVREIRGQLLRRDRVVRIVTNVLSAVRNHMLGIPSRVMHSLEGKTPPEINVAVRDEVHLALREASEFDARMFVERNGTKRGTETNSLNGDDTDD
jgi:phage terminase Nu1 subunit (DNA packaging protein)